MAVPLAPLPRVYAVTVTDRRGRPVALDVQEYRPDLELWLVASADPDKRGMYYIACGDEARPACTCPAGQNSVPCKHIRGAHAAAASALIRAARDAGDDALASELIAAGVATMDPEEEARQLAARREHERRARLAEAATRLVGHS